MIVAQLAVRCDECQAQHRSPHVTTVTKVGDATIDARMSAQANGWATRRNHGGRDLCPAHRIEAAA